MAADHPQHLHTDAVLNISPTLKMSEGTDLTLARVYPHWFLMLQPSPLPEQMHAGQVPFTTLGRALKIPTLAPWGQAGVIAFMFDCLADWHAVETNVVGRIFPCEYFISEETLVEIRPFLNKHPLKIK